MRIACGIEYDGSAYYGWQRQTNAVSVQQVIESALSTVADQEIQVVCAGRTDTGVHASTQVIHFDTEVNRPMHCWMLGGNTNLPKDVSICWAKLVSEEFHARFSAVERTYRYIVLNCSMRSALLNRRVTWWLKSVDIGRMQEAAKYLIGRHDFSSFRSSRCQAKSPVRELREISVETHAGLIYIDVRANAFLHHMVRNITGVLLAIGGGEQESEWAKTVLEARDRVQAGVTAPPDGLYLTDIQYPEHFEIPRIGYKPIYRDILSK